MWTFRNSGAPVNCGNLEAIILIVKTAHLCGHPVIEQRALPSQLIIPNFFGPKYARPLWATGLNALGDKRIDEVVVVKVVVDCKFSCPVVALVMTGLRSRRKRKSTYANNGLAAILTVSSVYRPPTSTLSWSVSW